MDLWSQQWIAGSGQLLCRIHNSICQEVEDLHQYISGVRWSTTVSVRSWRSYKYICRCNKQKIERLFNRYLIYVRRWVRHDICQELVSLWWVSFFDSPGVIMKTEWCDSIVCSDEEGFTFALIFSERDFLIYLKDVHSATTMLDFHTFDWYYFIGVFIYKFFILNSLNIFEFRLL